MNGPQDATGAAALLKEGEAGGSSNTPHRKPCFNTCIDYLKFRFDEGFDKDIAFFGKLLELLKVDVSSAHEEPGKNGYMKSKLLAIGTSIMYGGTITNTNDGQATTLLELKGSGCRDFEDRVYTVMVFQGTTRSRDDILREAWASLIKQCLIMDGHCTRVDLPTDDMSGTITAANISEKVKKREYTTLMRHLEITDANSLPEDDIAENLKAKLPGIPTVIDSKLSGYCAIFGGRQTSQLCIYDKKAEQNAKGIDVIPESWMRFEVRYYHQNAEDEIDLLLKALEASTEAEHIVGCLAAAIEFKEPKKISDDHRSRAETWSKWTAFLQGVRANDPFAKLEPTLTIESNVSWLVKEASKALCRVCATISKSPLEIIKILLVEGSGRLDKKDLQVINQRRRHLGNKEFVSVDEAMRHLFALPGMNINVSDELMELFYGKKSGS